MEGIIILGAAGLAKEFYFYIRRAKPEISDFVFVNDLEDGQEILEIEGKKFTVVKDWNFKEKYPFVVAVGKPEIKMALVEKAIKSGLSPAETMIDPSAIVLDTENSIGRGGVISPGCVVTTNVKIGDYVTLNLNTTVGHDTEIGDFCTTNPGVHISGQITMGQGNEFGTGSVVRDRLNLGSNKTFGAQAAIVKDVPGSEKETFIGIPSKKLSK